MDAALEEREEKSQRECSEAERKSSSCFKSNAEFFAPVAVYQFN